MQLQTHMTVDLLQYFLCFQNYFRINTAHLHYLILLVQQMMKAGSLSELRPRKVELKQVRSRPVTLFSNFVKINTHKLIEKLYIYVVRFTPMISKDNQKVFTALMNTVQKTFKKDIAICGNQLICLSPIMTEKELKDMKVSQGKQEYSASIRQRKILDVRENQQLLQLFLNNMGKGILLKKGFITYKRSGCFYDFKDQKKCNNYYIYNGYRCNFMTLNDKILLRVEPIIKISQKTLVLDFIKRIMKRMEEKKVEKVEAIIKVKEQLIGKQILPNYGKSRIYKVVDVIFDQNPTSLFSFKENEVSFQKYYRDVYNIEIKDKNQPLIEVENIRKGSTIKLLMVPECCIFSGITDDLHEADRRNLSKSSPSSATDKISHIKKLIKQLVPELNSLKEVSIEAESELALVEAKVLDKPTILLYDDKAAELRGDNIAGFTNRLYSKDHNANCLMIFPERSSGQIKNLLKLMGDTAKGIGLTFLCEKVKSYGERQNFFERADELLRRYEKQLSMVIAFAPQARDYKKLKQRCINIPSQCIRAQTLCNRSLPSIVTKIIHQISSKLGNVSWASKTTNYQALKQVCLVSFDSGPVKERITASVCITYDKHFSKMASKFETCSPNDKYATYAKIFIEALKKVQSRQRLRNIVIFLNFVTKDQIEIVESQLLAVISVGLKQAFKERVPKITAIMVDVKSSEKFFKNPDIMNPDGGTIISKTVAEENDWFLISQFAPRQKTAVPSHYKIIINEDSEFLTKNLLNELVYSQCFNYCNWSGAIKVPGVMQYAKKLAKFSSEVLEGGKSPDGKTSTTPYFV